MFNQYDFLGFVKDDNGANDAPAQSDLNAFTRADNVSDKIGVKWVWDDVDSWTGSGQTGDACALFDTDNDKKANAAVCVRITNPGGDASQIAQLEPGSPINYSCGDNKEERCASPVRVQSIGGIVCEVEKLAGEQFFSAGDDGADVQATCSIPYLAISASSPPNLLNVCSFPSGSPQSNPFDCVVTPGAGFLVIKKLTTPDNNGATFGFKVLPAPVSDSLFSVVDNQTGPAMTSLISALPRTDYAITENTLTGAWRLNSAICKFDNAAQTTTGTAGATGVSGFSITSGETTICTFDNRIDAPSLSVVKTAAIDSVSELGGNVGYSVVVTNSSAIAVTLSSLIDDKFGDMSGQGTCNAAGNLYGSIAAGGTYSCAFTGALAAANPGTYHINQVTASATSDGGPASAQDTARVRYFDVKPSITVSKTASQTTITAQGGLEVTGFVSDASYDRDSGGGGAGSIVFAASTCDDDGPNPSDEAAQADLNCFSRGDNVGGRLGLRWTWDDTDLWTGSGQTGDACALLNTDDDGYANFALCVRITNPNGDPNEIGQFTGSPILYKCSDGSGTRCTSKSSTVALDATSICIVSRVAEGFPGEGDDNADIQAECNLKLRDLGPQATNANVDLVNVCSFPSGSPTSNPFDCVVTDAAGFLVITNTTTPASDAYFGYTLGNALNTAPAAATNGFDAFEIEGGASSAAIPMVAGDYSVTEFLPSNWNLASISCTLNGATVGTTSSNSGLSIPIASGQTTFCTFTNALSASANVTFTVTVTNNSAESVTLTSLMDSENPTAGTPTFSTLAGQGTCNGTGNLFGTIAASGGTYVCTFTRTISGSPGFQHKDRVKAIGTDDENNTDTKMSDIVTVTIQ